MSEIAIIGLGAIGGSLALDLLANGERVIGYDVDDRALEWARAHNLEAHKWNDRAPATARVVIAVPVHQSESVLRALAGRSDYEMITDVSSTKRKIIREASDSGLAHCFVGAHPLAGTHESGANAARAGLFRDREVFLCASPASSDAAVEAANSLWNSVGAHVVAIDEETHDREIAWISHLPQLTANSLALALKAAGLPHECLGPGGRDMTRLAGSNAEVWQGVLQANGDMLDEPLACMIDALSELREVLRRGDASSLTAALRSSQSWYGA